MSTHCKQALLSQISNRKWRIQQQAHRGPDDFQAQDIPGPWTEGIDQAGGLRFGSNKQIIAPNELVQNEYGDHVDIRPDKNALERNWIRLVTFHKGHIDRRGDDCSVRDNHLEKSKWGKP